MYSLELALGGSLFQMETTLELIVAEIITFIRKCRLEKTCAGVSDVRTYRQLLKVCMINWPSRFSGAEESAICKLSICVPLRHIEMKSQMKERYCLSFIQV